MKFQKLVLCAAVAFACGAAINASAFDLGKLKSPASGNVDNDIKSFLQTAEEANALTSKSVYTLAQALLTKEEMQANDAKLEAARNIADPKEREAQLAKAELEMQAQLAKVDYEAQANQLAKANDKKKNALLGASIYNFVLGMLKDKELVGKGSGLASSAASNPMLLTKLGKVKDVVASISGQMGDMGKIASGLQKMSSKIKSVPMPTSASAEPVSTAD
ncbi:MAG: hypothetical protein ACJ8LG_20540 [Massilia sp.]